MMSDPMRVAIVGAGTRGHIVGQALLASGTGVPAGVWNRTPARAKALAQSMSTKAYESIGDMVTAEQPDLVAIVTNPAARSALLDEAVRSGAHAVLLEKPIALTREELERVRRAAGDAFVVVNTQYQWMDHWKELLDGVRNGRIGILSGIHGSSPVALLEQSPHIASLVTAIAHVSDLPPPTRVLAAADPVSGSLVADFDLGSARFSLTSGPVAPLVRDEPMIWYHQQLNILGSLGRIWVSLNRGWSMWDTVGLRTGSTEWPRDDAQSQQSLLIDLCAAIFDPGRQSTFPTRLEVAAREADWLFAALESASSGRPVSLGERLPA
jgi:predicted dehydrogenase